MIDIMEEFERNRRIYIGDRTKASEKKRRQYYAAIRRFVLFASTEAEPRAKRIRDINQDHYSQYVDSPQMQAKSAGSRYEDCLVIAIFAHEAGLKISINTAKLSAARASSKNLKANS